SEHQLVSLEDWSDAPSLFDAAVYPSSFVVRRGAASSSNQRAETRITVHAARVAATWGVDAGELGLDDTPGAPWLMLPPPARRSFDALRDIGIGLASSRFGAPLLGLKCGCNGAFIMRTEGDKVFAA